MSPLLWILLLAAIAAVGAFVWRSRDPRRAAPAPLPPSDDLVSLGLSEVRPATTPRSGPDPVARPDPAPRRDPATRSASPDPRPSPSRPAPISTVSEPRSRASAPDDAYVRSDSPLWPDTADAVRPLLRSLAVSIGGGAAVLRHDGDVYAVDALVGVPGVRSPRPLPAGEHALHRIPQDTVLSILGPSSRQSLSYYADPDAAVGQAVARALAEPPARRVLLVADVPPGHDELSDDALALVARYGDLLAALSTLDDDGAASRTEPAASPDLKPDAEARPDEATRDEESVLPRAVVLQRAIDAARDAERPLAFALVTPADADALLGGDPERVAAAEADLRARLDGRPVRAAEPFGDLMLGAFLDADAESARAWATALADTAPPLLIGLVETVGDDPDAARAAATSALEAAYHQGGGLAVAE